MTGARPFSNSWHRPWGGKERASQTDSAIEGGLRPSFECAASTARDDLNRLVDLRYCSTAYQGKKQVFWLNEARWL